jgi:cell division protein FtsX
VIAEASAIGLLGAALGFGVHAAIFGVAREIVRAQTGVVLEAFSFHPVVLLGPVGVVALCAAAGVIPGWVAYRTEAASTLSRG